MRYEKDGKAAALFMSRRGDAQKTGPPPHRGSEQPIRRLPAVSYRGGGGNSSSSDVRRGSSDLRWEMRGGALWVSGEIDLNEASAFQEIAGEYIRKTDEPRLDLSGVEFIDSAGLAALLALVRQAQREGKMLRAQVGGSPRRVLQITGIDKLLMVED